MVKFAVFNKDTKLIETIQDSPTIPDNKDDYKYIKISDRLWNYIFRKTASYQIKNAIANQADKTKFIDIEDDPVFETDIIIDVDVIK